MYFAPFLLAFLFNKYADGDALPDIKNILVLRSVGAFFFLKTIAMQIQNIYLVEAIH